MSQFVFKDAYLSIGGNSMAGYTADVAINSSVDLVENTSHGDSWKKRLPSLKDFSIDVTLRQDFANGNIDDLLWALFGTEVAVEVRPTSSAVGSSNPKYTGQAILSEYKPIQGKVGDLAVVSVKLTGTGALTRAES